jgi:thiol-disulfide isomerase/thioredoxin
MNTFSSKRDLIKSIKQCQRVLVLFCASWCPFCREFFPKFDRAVSKNSFDKVLRVYVDDDDNPLWEDYSLEAVPTAILFTNGEEASRLDAQLGFGLNEKAFVNWLRKPDN